MPETVLLSTGFAKPWIEWETEGHDRSRSLLIDDLPVPVMFVECSSTAPLPHPEDCTTGIEFVCQLENGLYAISCLDADSSAVWLVPDPEEGGTFIRTETGVRVHPECEGYSCGSCFHGPCFDLTSYETREELMAKLNEWSGWTVEGLDSRPTV
jgi:hypothetical protein